jgi:hypothetical protein
MCSSVGTVGKLALVINDTTQASVALLYSDVAASDTYNYLTYKASITNAGSATSGTVFLRSVAPHSRGAYYNDIGYFVVLYESSLQATYLVLDLNKTLVAKIAANQAGTHASQTVATNFNVGTESDTFTVGILRKGRIQSANAELFANLIPYEAVVDFDATSTQVDTKAQGSVIVSGGIVTQYDGVSAIEYGFTLGPDYTTPSDVSAGGSVSNDTYIIYAVYEWIDANGIRHLSAPSPANTHTKAGGNAIQVTVPTYRFTDKTGSRSEVKIRVYMTEASGTLPYFITSADNDLSVNSININVLAEPDGSTEILYTASGAVENEAPPAARFVVTHDNRLWCLGTEVEDEIFYSKEFKADTGVGFNSDFKITLDPFGGKVTAGASMDDYLIVMKETATYAVSGSGPNDLGQDNTYSKPKLISADVGCQDPKSVLTMPTGIIFKSRKGFHILSRGLQTQYIGAAVEDYNNDTCYSSILLNDRQEIRFTMSSGVILVYNYFFNRWTVIDAPGCLDATIWKNTDYVYLTSSKVLQEDTSTYLRDGSYVQSKIRTGWIALAGVQGYQRIYKMAMLGTYHTDHKFNVTHYYDYSDLAQDVNTITASDLVNTATYGDSATYGADDYYGGSQNNEVYQLREDVPRQKCESISFEFTDSLVNSNAGQGFSLNAISLTVGVKKGLYKTSSTRSR